MRRKRSIRVVEERPWLCCRRRRRRYGSPGGLGAAATRDEAGEAEAKKDRQGSSGHAEVAGEADLALENLLRAGGTFDVGSRVRDDDGGALASESDGLEFLREAIGFGLGLGEGLVGDDWVLGLGLEVGKARAQRLGDGETGSERGLTGSEVTEATDFGDDGAVAADLGDDVLEPVGRNKGSEHALWAVRSQRLAGRKHEAALLGGPVGGRDEAHVAGLDLGDACAWQ